MKKNKSIYWWQRLDVEPSEKDNVHDFMEEKNFLWEVLTFPCYTYVNGKYIEIDRNRVVARSDDMKPMYVVKKQYKLMNNEECFQVMNLFKEKYENSKFVSCGDILNQKKSYLTMILKKIKICDDDFLVYVTTANGFDGRNAINCTLSLLRESDHAVFQMADEQHKRIWTMGRLDTTLNFDQVYKEVEEYIKFAQDLGEELNKKEIVLNDILKPLFELDWKKSKCVNLHMAEQKEYIREIYIKNGGKSLYNLYMAISSYYCNYRNFKNGKLGDDLRFDFAMIGYFYELCNYTNYIIKNLTI